jgi:diphthamide biosynthesis methyltransferase
MTLAPDFDWVTARAECSISRMFVRLHTQVMVDVERRNSLVSANERLKFLVEVHGDSEFSVRHEEAGQEEPGIVRFRRTESAIVVASNDGTVKLAVTLAVDHLNECRFVINGEHVEEWHFRKLALEGLFFGRSAGW